MRLTTLRVLPVAALAALLLTFAAGFGGHRGSTVHAQTVVDGTASATMTSTSGSSSGNCLAMDSWCNYCSMYANAAICTAWPPVYANSTSSSSGSSTSADGSTAAGSGAGSTTLPAYGLPIPMPAAPTGMAWVFCTGTGYGPVWMVAGPYNANLFC